MANIQEQIAQAKSAGYDDAAIIQHLSGLPEYSSKIKTATEAGYKPSDIIGYLAPAKTAERQNVAAEKERGFFSLPSNLAEAKADLRKSPFGQAAMGLYRGIADVSDTLAKGGASVLDYVMPTQAGKPTLRQQADTQADANLRRYQQLTGDGTVASMGRLGGNVLATLPVGGMAAKPLNMLAEAAPSVARFVTPVATAIESGGFRTGMPEATTVGQKLIQKAVQATGGAVTGAASSGLINPEDAETGALIGAAVPTVVAPVAKGVANLGGKVYDLATGKTAEVQAGKLAREMAGKTINEIRAANGAAPIDITTAQATAGINNDVWQAFLDVVQGKDKNAVFSALKTKQAQDQFNTLASLAGGANQAEAKGSREATNKLLNLVTTPLREENLLAANVGKDVIVPLQNEAAAAKQTAADKVAEVRRLEAIKNRAINPAPGNLMSDYPLSNIPAKADALSQQAAAESLAQGQVARTAEQKIADFKARGIEPLDISGVTGKLRRLATAPGTRADPVQVKVLSSLENQIKDLAERNGGIIDANDLYQIRKTGINDTIEAELRSGGLDPSTQSKRIADMLGQVRPLVDEAIEKAGGKGWKDYLATHAAGMRQIEQKELAAKAMELYKRSPKDFIELVKGNNVKAVEDIFGPGNYDVFKTMGDKMVKLQKVAGEVERDVIDIPAKIAAGRRALEITEPSVASKIPGFVGYKTALAKKFVQVAEGKINQKTMDALIKGAENGKNMNELLNNLPAQERLEVLKVLRNSKDWDSFVTRGAASMGADNSPENRLSKTENRNALAR